MICLFVLSYKDKMINVAFSLNQVEQADVIMAEYREGWAARAEKVTAWLCCEYNVTRRHSPGAR